MCVMVAGELGLEQGQRLACCLFIILVCQHGCLGKTSEQSGVRGLPVVSHKDSGIDFAPIVPMRVVGVSASLPAYVIGMPASERE